MCKINIKIKTVI